MHPQPIWRHHYHFQGVRVLDVLTSLRVRIPISAKSRPPRTGITGKPNSSATLLHRVWNWVDIGFKTGRLVWFHVLVVRSATSATDLFMGEIGTGVAFLRGWVLGVCLHDANQTLLSIGQILRQCLYDKDH